jgi:uncharacterized protein (DUF305 family)
MRLVTPLSRISLSTRGGFLAIICAFALTAAAQDPVVVQPGAPGKPTKVLPANTRPSLQESSRKDIEFMQGMIMHHAQAVEMTALINSRTQNKELRLLGARISHSQSEEMRFMERWLQVRGEPSTMAMPSMPGMDHMHMSDHEMLMPGMLSAKQMNALKKAKGKEFDKLFLSGMIQHHNGALVMVDEMFKSAGGGQDADLFNFATDVDSGQRAEIKIMQAMLDEKS